MWIVNLNEEKKEYKILSEIMVIPDTNISVGINVDKI